MVPNEKRVSGWSGKAQNLLNMIGIIGFFLDMIQGYCCNQLCALGYTNHPRT